MSFFKPNNAVDLKNTISNIENNLQIERENFVQKFNYRNIIENYTSSMLT